MITDISAELEKEFGAPGTPERAKFDEEAYAFYTGQILLDARKEAKVTQLELAKRINATKSYISRIENGSINPSVGTFYRIMNALGLRVEIVNRKAGALTPAFSYSDRNIFPFTLPMFIYKSAYSFRPLRTGYLPKS